MCDNKDDYDDDLPKIKETQKEREGEGEQENKPTTANRLTELTLGFVGSCHAIIANILGYSVKIEIVKMP